MDIKNHVEVLLRLAMVDNQFDDSESDLIKMIAKANGVSTKIWMK